MDKRYSEDQMEDTISPKKARMNDLFMAANIQECPSNDKLVPYNNYTKNPSRECFDYTEKYKNDYFNENVKNPTFNNNTSTHLYNYGYLPHSSYNVPNIKEYYHHHHMPPRPIHHFKHSFVEPRYQMYEYHKFPPYFYHRPPGPFEPHLYTRNTLYQKRNKSPEKQDKTFTIDHIMSKNMNHSTPERRETLINTKLPYDSSHFYRAGDGRQLMIKYPDFIAPINNYPRELTLICKRLVYENSNNQTSLLPISTTLWVPRSAQQSENYNKSLSLDNDDVEESFSKLKPSKRGRPPKRINYD